MWKLAESYEGMNKNEIMDEIEKRLGALTSVIPQIKGMKFERDILRSERSFDMLYLVEFDSLEDLEIYRVHPEHVKVAGFIASVRVAQTVTDTEI